MERGEPPADPDLDVLVDRLVGPIHHRVLVTGEPVGPGPVEALITACTPGPCARS
ncbi:TetR-like C-terminal domain-containing protein [Actinoplanes sp. NPDC049316]|uniref:TetR-like C-terminal domain-containing protein n=1 Tax=Actinoplanes sp. NPDC049316 TaxID=3154727 RepID=UPI00343DC6AA